MYRIRINPLALKDLQELKAYITEELCKPDAAAATVQKIIARYEQLAEYPLMGAELSTMLNLHTNYRYLLAVIISSSTVGR